MPTSSGLAQCPVRGCPVRYAAGPDRLCRVHNLDGDIERAAAELGIDLAAPPAAKDAGQPRERQLRL